MPDDKTALSFEGMQVGEKVHVTVKRCFLMVNNPMCEVPGRLLATNYRLKFQTQKGALRQELHWMQKVNFFDIPMGTIEDIKVEKMTTTAGATELKVKLVTKDIRTIVWVLSQDGDLQALLDAVKAFSTPGNTTLLFAFRHAELRGVGGRYGETDGWGIYDPMQEYACMGIETEMIPSPSCPWKLSDINQEYSLCATYPNALVFPRSMQDWELRSVAHFRKKGRLPAMSWCGGPEMNFASVWRCSQSTEGLAGHKCAEDEKLVDCLRRGTGNNSRDLLVIDLRPWKSAWVNKAGGGGFEGYKGCSLVFGGIDNVHAVREGWRAMGNAVAAVTDGEVGSWFKDVANSSWYDYIGAIMNCTLKVVKEIVDKRCNVMVHCSDGWDRTAQTTSLSMLCLDAQYRTMPGFFRLIQKEWCSFGHQFRTRLALGESPSGEYSPVFFQWLECVFQLLQQYPTSFEWTADLLLRLVNDVTSNRYGTFLCDTERERTEKVQPYTISLWCDLLEPSTRSMYTNPRYRFDRTPLKPKVSQANYVIWEAYWYRYHVRIIEIKEEAEAAAAAVAEAAAAAASAAVAAEMPAPVEMESTSPVEEAIMTEPSSSATGENAPQEVISEPVPEPPIRPVSTQVFADDDDEDVFAKKPT